MSVRIVYEDIAAGADEDASASAPGAAEFSDVSRLPFGGSTVPIASFEPYSWLLDGSREILDQQPVAYWSEAMSGIDGIFEEPPEITFTFDKRYTSPGVFLAFDTSTGDYCTRVTAEWHRGENLLKKKEFYPTGPEYFCGQTVEAWDKIVLRFHSTNLPFHYLKLTHIIFGVAREFLRDELRNVHITQEASILSSEVAVNTLDFTLDSKGDVEYMFQFKQPLRAYDSDHLIGVFYISDSKHRAKGLYNISSKDAIGVLDDDPFPAGMYTEYPAKDLLLDILGGHFKLEMDASLIAATVTGYLQAGSRRQALQQVAFALRAIVDTSGTDAVRVYVDKETLPVKFPPGKIYTGGTVDTSAIVTAVRVTAHSYSLTGSGNDTVEVGGKTYYHTTEIITINNPNATASDKQNVIEVDQATLVNPSNAAAIAQHIYGYYTKRQTQKIKIVMAGERPGDHVAAPTPWGTMVDGFITSMRIVLSGIAAADCEIVGVDVRAVGGTEAIMSGEVYAGEV